MRKRLRKKIRKRRDFEELASHLRKTSRKSRRMSWALHNMSESMKRVQGIMAAVTIGMREGNVVFIHH